MKFHDTLNDKIWDLNTEDLIPEVKEKLEEIAEAFIEFLEIPTDAVLDKVITGSSASYNYNEFSDLDLHIIVDYDKVHEDCPLVNGYLNSLKKQFNDNHDIFIHGVPVELYAEQKDQGTVHNGLYSLQTGWIDKPQKIEPTDNDAAVEAKYNEIKELVDKCDDSEEATELLEKIYNMRKAGLAEAGEFCTENLAFKKLRNEGCMDKLRQIKKEKIDKQLSLESYNESVKDYNIGDTITIDGKQGVIDSLFKLQDDGSLLGAWVKFNDDVVYYTLEELDDMKNESIKEELTIDKQRLKNLMFQYLDDIDHKAPGYYKHQLKVDAEHKDYIDVLTVEIAKDYLKGMNLQAPLQAQFDAEHVLTDNFEQWLNEYQAQFNESIKEDYEEDDCENCPEEMHKERYAIYFETQEGNKKYTVYHVYTDSTDDSYNELCDKKDNQLGMYDSYKELKDALKERAEKIAKQQGWTVKSIENLGEDDEYYRERNKWESIHKLNRTINKAIGEDMEKEPVYHYSVEDIDKQGNDFDNAEEAYEQAQKDLTALGYEVKELNDDGEFEIVSTSTGVAHTGVIYPSNPELDESLQWEICRDMEKGHFYICNDEEIYCDPDGEPYHFNTREEAEEFLHTLNEDATTLEKKMDVTQDTLNDLLKSITDVREDFDLDKAYNLINEALKED